MYLCDMEGCPKAGQPLTHNMIKNHRKTFKKYGACFKSLKVENEGETLSHQIRSQAGKSIYPRKCENPGCPNKDELLSKCVYNNHKRSFAEYNVCNRRQQLERDKNIYPLKCQNPGCTSKKLLKQKPFTRHLENYKKYGKCRAPQVRKFKQKEFPKLCKNPDCPR